MATDQVANICICGHSKGNHMADSPHPCLVGDCKCMAFTTEEARGYPETLPMRGLADVEQFWCAASQADLDMVLEKLQSYGSLSFHASCMLLLVGRPHASTREGTELAIASYVAGKLNRILESLSHGVLPSEDSWADLARYAMMARYVRKYGEWP